MEPFRFRGVGIHSGCETSAEVRPGADGQGIVFIRDGVRIPANVDSVSDTSRCTCLAKDGVSVSTVEHLLSVCFALGVSDLDILLEGPELPILDGSSIEILKKFKSAGVQVTDTPRRVFTLKSTVHAYLGDSFIVAMPSRSFLVSCMVDYNHPVVGVQAGCYDGDPEQYEKRIAPARTFGFWEEIQSLLEKNLARGGSLENAFIIKKDSYMNPPRFPDEVVMHKLLDLIGDLGLLGGDIQGNIFAYKPSHRLNAKFASLVKESGDL